MRRLLASWRVVPVANYTFASTTSFSSGSRVFPSIPPHDYYGEFRRFFCPFPFDHSGYFSYIIKTRGDGLVQYQLALVTGHHPPRRALLRMLRALPDLATAASYPAVLGSTISLALGRRREWRSLIEIPQVFAAGFFVPYAAHLHWLAEIKIRLNSLVDNMSGPATLRAGSRLSIIVHCGASDILRLYEI